jgi:hypothetical protein
MAPTNESYYTELLRTILSRRPVILTGGPVAGLTETARAVRDLGARSVFVLGSGGRGSGATPSAQVAEWLALEVSAGTMVEGIRAGQQLLSDLPPYAREAIDRFDPNGEALVLGGSLNELPEVAGRPCLGYRHREWVALEDKVMADQLWDRAGIERAPSVVVAADRDVLARASKKLDRGFGTVWTADARDGYHGGAEGLRWVRNAADAEEATAFLLAKADRIRVMPFLEGVPCSIHGVVFDDYVAAMRPLEMVTLRPKSGPKLCYAGVASFWDPLPEDRELMREVARRVGSLLRAEVGFRGGFTVDGVLTADGFRPTELNPRLGAIRVLVAGDFGLTLEILNEAISAGMALDWSPAELEHLVVTVADRNRGGGTWRVLPTAVPDMVARPLQWDTDAFRWADETDAADGWVTTGPSPVGGFVRLTLNPARTAIGSSVAAQAASFWGFSDAALGTRIGPLFPARSVR